MGLIVHFDGGSRGNPGPAAAGVVIHDAERGPILEAGYFLGRMTNNQAEYHGLLRALEAVGRLADDDVAIYSDSELLVRQITGVYKVKSALLQPLFERARRMLRDVPQWRIQHVMREGNQRADELANAAMDCGADVIEVDTSTDAAQPSAPTKRAKPAGIVASVTQPPDDAICPAPCKKGVRFLFEGSVPAGLCVNAAHALLGSVLALERAPTSDEADPTPLTVHCPRADCGATFEVARQS